MADWWVYRGDNLVRGDDLALPEPPSWRAFAGDPAGTPAASPPLDEDVKRAQKYRPSRETIEVVNSAIYLRRPLLVTGNPGTGKSTLAFAVAHELGLGRVLRWPITSRATLQDGLYRYDPLARLYAATQHEGRPEYEDIGRFVRLGPLGTAMLPSNRPRVLLIDEFDKSDLDLPNDLLNVFEEGRYEIPELVRIAREFPRRTILTDDGETEATITGGKIQCREFPLVVMTSNNERDFPAAFLRRCVRLVLDDPDEGRLDVIVRAHLGPLADTAVDLIRTFMSHRSAESLATDQLLNAIYLTHQAGLVDADREAMAARLFRNRTGGADGYGR